MTNQVIQNEQIGKVKFPHLFQEGQIGSLKIKNRIVKSPQSTGLSNMDGTVSDRSIRYYREIARGGAGLIMVEYTYIDNIASKSAHNQLGISSNEHIAGLSWLVSNVHDLGAKIGLQIEHCGRQKFLGTPPVKAASRIPWPAIYEQTGIVPEELTIEEIKQIVEDFGDGALRAKKAGFDLVEIHAAHGYLITNFLSPHTNKRNDLYGGSLENRKRFLEEIIMNVRSKVGKDFPLSVRINGTDYEPDGITIEETVIVCKRLEELGVDVLHVSGGDHHTMVYQTSPMTIPNGPNVWAAEAIKEAVSIPVMASGSINTPAFAEQVLGEKKADFISNGRPLFADPHWPKKALEGRTEDIIPCIRCNDGCLERTFYNFRSIRCTVNPNTGREGELPITPASQKKRIAIIGGGPAGMEAARVSALRGHEVTLYEKGELGGSLHAASVSSFKADIRNLINYFVAQMNKLNINVVNKEATLADIDASQFDEVIVAVGGVPAKLNVPGENQSNVVHAVDVLRGKVDVGENVVVIGGGFTGMEVAVNLADQAKKVSIVSQPGEGKDILQTFQMTYDQMLKQRNLSIQQIVKVEAIREEGIMVQNENGTVQHLQADTIVVAAGYKENGGLKKQLKENTGLEVHMIGDGDNPGRIYDAIHSAYLTAMHI